LGQRRKQQYSTARLFRPDAWKLIWIFANV
jgi:hypothetical protein